jgi:hypothetical protein
MQILGSVNGISDVYRSVSREVERSTQYILLTSKRSQLIFRALKAVVENKTFVSH